MCVKLGMGGDGIYISVLKHASYLKFDMCVLDLRHRILSLLNFFDICSTHFNIWSESSISEGWNIVGRYNNLFSKYVHQTLIYTNYEPCYARFILYHVAKVLYGSVSQV